MYRLLKNGAAHSHVVIVQKTRQRKRTVLTTQTQSKTICRDILNTNYYNIVRQELS